MDSPNYFHGHSPLTIRWALDAHAGLQAIWSFMAGSPLEFSGKWEPARGVLNAPGHFTLGINTNLGKTGASRVITAYFGESLASSGVTIGEDQPWELLSHPSGCGSSWRRSPGWGQGLSWPGSKACDPWPEPPGVFTAWGEASLSGLPRPLPRSTDPLESWIPPTLSQPPEEFGILGWMDPLGLPAAALPRRTA